MKRKCNAENVKKVLRPRVDVLVWMGCAGAEDEVTHEVAKECLVLIGGVHCFVR